MTAMASMGNLVVALPPSDIWLSDEQAADFLGYANTYFKASIICLKGFPKPRHIMANSKGRRWNLKMLSDWLSERPDDLKIKKGLKKPDGLLQCNRIRDCKPIGLNRD